MGILNLAKMDHKLRPTLAKILPASTFIKLYSATRPWFIKRLAEEELDTVDGHFYPIEVMGLKFRNDLGNAAGLDKDGSLLGFQYQLGAGFAVVGTVLNRPHTGNLFSAFGRKHNPWVPLPGSDSALNSLGLPSKGIDPVLDNIKYFQDQYHPKDFPIGFSIMGHPLDEGEAKFQGVLDCVKKAAKVADFIEINESCPNVKHKQKDMGELNNRLKLILEVAREQSNLPILVKLGQIHDMAGTLDALADAKVNGLVALNTQTNYEQFKENLTSSDYALLEKYTSEFNGGLSGAAIRSFARDKMKEARAYINKHALDLSLVHVGGIASPEDIVESRSFAELREWYSCFLSALASQDPRQIYQVMTEKK